MLWRKGNLPPPLLDMKIGESQYGGQCGGSLSNDIEPEGGHLVFNPTMYSGGVMIQDGNNTAAKHVKIGVSDYGLKVGDIAVTSINRDDILGDGKVTYNPETNTLTLNNATITGDDCIYVAKTLSGLKILVRH